MSRLHISETLNFLRASLSLTPCFSWVTGGMLKGKTVSTVSRARGKPLKRLRSPGLLNTLLKQGVNKTCGLCLENVWSLAKDQ